MITTAKHTPTTPAQLVRTVRAVLRDHDAYPRLVRATREYLAAQERRGGRNAMDEARARFDLRDLLRELGEEE